MPALQKISTWSGASERTSFSNRRPGHAIGAGRADQFANVLLVGFSPVNRPMFATAFLPITGLRAHQPCARGALNERIPRARSGCERPSKERESNMTRLLKIA